MPPRRAPPRPAPPPPPRNPQVWDYDLATSTCCGIATTPTDTLSITSWMPLEPGGHSYVFLVRHESGEEWVIKLFRFASLTPRPGDPEHTTAYVYFRNEARSYVCLSSTSTSSTSSSSSTTTFCSSSSTSSSSSLPTPRLYKFLTLAPTHESHLSTLHLLRGLDAPRHRRYYRRSAAEMPVVGVAMEYLSGCVRLSRSMLFEDHGREVVEKVKGGLRWVHERGVLQRDVKWRNVLVVGDDGEGDKNGGEQGENKKRVVWIDFSNAATREMVCEAGRNWEEDVQIEEEALEKMLKISVSGGQRGGSE